MERQEGLIVGQIEISRIVCNARERERDRERERERDSRRTKTEIERIITPEIIIKFNHKLFF